jgi:protein-S-isoprenylcysteine O-methyltransferase Ste14
MDLEGIAWIALAFILWALLHSLTAARPLKRWVQRRAGKRAFRGFYRLSYNILSVLTILPLLYLLATRIPFVLLWRLPAPFSVFFLAVQMVGLVGLVVSLLQTDVWRFAGVRQALRFIAGAEDPDPPGALVQSGAYRLVRHPLYFFSMLFIWFVPLMTLNSLIFNLLATAYFLVGALHEERRLLSEFGERYRRYREQVPAFLPWPR